MVARVAIVTGSSRGIGRAIAEHLAADGCAVVVNYVTRADAAESVVDRIRASGGDAVAVQADVGQLTDHQRLIETALQEWGRLDVLVNNAGITSPGRKDLMEATPEAWDRVMAVNLRGPFFLAQRAARTMIELRNQAVIENGYLVNVSSISAYTVSLNRADYCIAKAGLQMLTWLFATRLAEEAIQVFEVCPGIIATEMTEAVRSRYDNLIVNGLTPIRRWGEPEDVARAVASVVSGAFPFTTGQRIDIDGGFHMRRL
jgi:NAD(P)-dependent dehydrogenase (short-subunit alcohol dehydrogenase family)